MMLSNFPIFTGHFDILFCKVPIQFFCPPPFPYFLLIYSLDTNPLLAVCIFSSQCLVFLTLSIIFVYLVLSVFNINFIDALKANISVLFKASVLTPRSPKADSYLLFHVLNCLYFHSSMIYNELIFVHGER